MASKLEHATTLAAILMDESHFCQSDSAFREAYYQRTGERYASAAPHIAARDALALIKVGAGVARWAVRECNGQGRQVWHQPGAPASGQWVWTWGEDDALKHRLADQRAEKKANEIAARYGAVVKIGGDPRGYTLRLILATGRTNTMGNDGWGVA